MGLDITAYSKIHKLNAMLDDGGEAVNPETMQPIETSCWFSTWKNPDFPGRADDIEDNAVYQYEDCTGHGVGYGGHYHWRDELAKLSGYPAVEIDVGFRKEASHFVGACQSSKGPFYELINFSDSEGVIGTAVSKKLLSDFNDYENKALDIGGTFYELYKHWKSAFEMASDGGCVIFH